MKCDLIDRSYKKMCNYILILEFYSFALSNPVKIFKLPCRYYIIDLKFIENRINNQSLVHLHPTASELSEHYMSTQYHSALVRSISIAVAVRMLLPD
jgi:hypothetical protein